MLGDDGLTGERRLVNLEVGRLYQGTVGRNFVADFDNNDVADDNVLTRHLDHLAVAAHLDGRLLAQRRKHVELLCGVHLEPEAYRCGKHDGKDDADSLDKITVDGCQRERNDSCDKQDFNDRVLVFLKIEFPKGSPLGRSKRVLAMLLAALNYFVIRQSARITE